MNFIRFGKSYINYKNFNVIFMFFQKIYWACYNIVRLVKLKCVKRLMRNFHTYNIPVQTVSNSISNLGNHVDSNFNIAVGFEEFILNNFINTDCAIRNEPQITVGRGLFIQVVIKIKWMSNPIRLLCCLILCRLFSLSQIFILLIIRCFWSSKLDS